MPGFPGNPDSFYCTNARIGLPGHSYPVSMASTLPGLNRHSVFRHSRFMSENSHAISFVTGMATPHCSWTNETAVRMAI